MKTVDGLDAAAPRIQSEREELANAITHGIGFVASLIAGPILLFVAARRNSSGFFIGAIVYAITLSFLYFSSMLYHAYKNPRGKSFWCVIDHSAIFLLIAGTYTPFGLGPLSTGGGLMMLGVVWSLALCGVAMKATRGTSYHPRLSLSLYLGTGWVGIFLVQPVTSVIPLSPLLWLLAGGIAYTVGVLFFVSKRLPYAHFVWHLFVLAGSSCHFAAVISCTG